jgi:MOSC domain-containing protein YiiM
VTGTILQINISRGGIPKRPIADGNLTVGGFVGDSWNHPQLHGGPDQMVLLIASEAIELLRAKGFPVYPGALGENLTTVGLDYTAWRKGQQFTVGEAVIELTKIRKPCNTLNVYGPAIKQEISDNWALGGFYARVIRPGLVFPGNAIRLVSELA